MSSLYAVAPVDQLQSGSPGFDCRGNCWPWELLESKKDFEVFDDVGAIYSHIRRQSTEWLRSWPLCGTFSLILMKIVCGNDDGRLRGFRLWKKVSYGTFLYCSFPAFSWYLDIIAYIPPSMGDSKAWQCYLVTYLLNYVSDCSLNELWDCCRDGLTNMFHQICPDI